MKIIWCILAVLSSVLGCSKPKNGPEAVCNYLYEKVKVDEDDTESFYERAGKDKGECIKTQTELKDRFGAEVYAKVSECLLKQVRWDYLEHDFFEKDCSPELLQLSPAEQEAKGKAKQAAGLLFKLYQAARTYCVDQGSPSLLGVSGGPTPPLGECCKNGGECSDTSAYWRGEPWATLGFSGDPDQRYSFEYKVDGSEFDVRAYGDLDCDGVYSTFTMHGALNGEYGPCPAGTVPLFREKELE